MNRKSRAEVNEKGRIASLGERPFVIKCGDAIMSDIRIIDGFENMNPARVTELLRKTPWWGEELKEETVIKGANSSALAVGAFIGNKQIGYCRAVSDLIKVCYIADVFVDEEFRGLGAAKAMVDHILNHEMFSDIFRFCLITESAHGLYEKCGFCRTKRPNDWMELIRERQK